MVKVHFDPEDYKPEVFEESKYKYAKTILSTKDISNLQWAKDFMDAYERKHKMGKG